MISVVKEDNLEPECANNEAGYRRSMAVSLKRIADTLDKMAVEHKPVTAGSLFESVFGK